MPYYHRVTLLISFLQWIFCLFCLHFPPLIALIWTTEACHKIHIHPSNPPPGQFSRPFYTHSTTAELTHFSFTSMKNWYTTTYQFHLPQQIWRSVATFEPKIEIAAIRNKHKSHHNPPLLDWCCRHVSRLSCISLCKNDGMAIDHLIGIQINIMTNPYCLETTVTAIMNLTMTRVWMLRLS